MDIGIIGSGQIGGTLARKLTALGHNVSIANSRGPASLTELSAETGAKAVTVEEAAKAKDVVIVKWKAIWDHNRDILKDPDKIYPGQELKIPM